MHGLIFETSIWLLAGSTRYLLWALVQWIGQCHYYGELSHLKAHVSCVSFRNFFSLAIQWFLNNDFVAAMQSPEEQEASTSRESHIGQDQQTWPRPVTKLSKLSNRNCSTSFRSVSMHYHAFWGVPSAFWLHGTFFLFFFWCLPRHLTPYIGIRAKNNALAKLRKFLSPETS